MQVSWGGGGRRWLSAAAMLRYAAEQVVCTQQRNRGLAAGMCLHREI